MAITKYESYYNKIREHLEVIKEEQGYNNLSLAFAHWFLKVQFNMNEQEIGEAIIDGDGDNGIDAIIHNEENNELIVLQFKFPQSTDYLNKEIDKETILKAREGFEILIGASDDERSNKDFIAHKDYLKDKEIYTFKIMFVSFNKGIIDNKPTIENFIHKFAENYGGSISYEDFNKNKISNLYEKINRKNSIEINLKYKLMQTAYNVDNIDSYIGVINGKSLVEAIHDKLLVIFDENIRLYEQNSKVNDGIKITGSSSNANMFYFYNNGIVFICDDANISPNSLSIRLKGASIVNGCQTTNTLAKLEEQGKLSPDVDLLIRIIKISDYDQRTKITEYLNSQTPIKDSYFISNHTIVRELQTSLVKEGYYLERQIDETSYKKAYGEEIDSNLKVIKLEDTIQYFTGYYIDKYASLAKSGKGALFTPERIEEILGQITSNKAVEAYEMYQSISEILTKYRKMRRTPNNTEFADFLGVSNSDLQTHSSEFLFVNTGDILILNTTENLKNKYKELQIEYDTNSIIKDAILICKDVIKENKNILDSTPASITKNSKVFNLVKNKIKNMEKEPIGS